MSGWKPPPRAGDEEADFLVWRGDMPEKGDALLSAHGDGQPVGQ